MTVSEASARPVPDHPARFSKAILAKLREMLASERDRVGHVRVLDPFAGVGTVHELAEERVETFGVELQKEWAVAHPDTICGSVLELPSLFPAATFDCVVTSCCYANRMSDSHDARERCSRCGGEGHVERLATPEEVDSGHELGIAFDQCEPCGGTGRRDHRRNTYTHALARSGVEIVRSDDNAAIMPWGKAYRDLHERAWEACDRVLRPGGLVLLNLKNHVRAGKVQRVVEFHVNCWMVLGYTIEEARRVETRGLAYGTNHDVRTPAELIFALRKPS